MIVVIASAICPADDHFQHDNVLADSCVHVLLLFTKIIHKTLETVFVKILERHKAARGDFMNMQVIAGESNMAVTSTSSIADPRWFTLEPAGISILPQLVAM